MIKDMIAYYQARFDVDEEGATMIEYGLLAALIAVALIGAIAVLTGGLSAIFEGIGTRLTGEAGNTGS